MELIKVEQYLDLDDCGNVKLYIVRHYRMADGSIRITQN